MLTLRPAIVKPNLWDFCAFDPMLIFTRCTTAGHMAPFCEKNAQTEKKFGTFAKSCNIFRVSCIIVIDERLSMCYFMNSL